MKKSSAEPLVSVIVPVRNEAAFIERSLSSLAAQTYPKNRIEIIVADGMSTDGTRKKIEQISVNSEIPISIVDNIKRIAPTGLNCALRKASGEIIIRIDGHCEVDPDYVANCVELLGAGKADGVGGPIETIGETPRARAIAMAMSSKFGVGGSAFRTINDREMLTDTVAFPGYTRAIIDRAGPFDEELVRNQDDEYNFRIRKLGGRILLSPSIRSRYFSRSTFRSLWRQYFQYGYWKVRVLQLHPRQMSARQFVPFAFVLSVIILSLSAVFFSVGRWGLLALIGTYAIANIAASIMVGIKHPRSLLYLSISFAILHVSYGLGSLAGLVAFRNRWAGKPIG